jgi:hypothetical protein
VLARGIRRQRDVFIGAGRWDPVVSVELAQKLIAIGFARLDANATASSA